MAKSEQFIPLSEEQWEEKNRVSKGDKEHETFVPIEEVPDGALLPDQFYDEPNHEEKIAALKQEIKHGHSLFGKQKLAELLKQPSEKPLGYMRGDGVASVGPDVIEDMPDADEAMEDREGIREKVSDVTAEPEKWNMRHYRNGPKREENLKNLTASKRERSSRGWLSRLLKGEDENKAA